MTSSNFTILYYFILSASLLFSGCNQARRENNLAVLETGNCQFNCPNESPRTFRASSADPDWQSGNGDCRPIEPGQTLTLAQIEGPALINHIWFTITPSQRFFPRQLVLRMYWDNSDTPAVESPIGDFFAVGHGLQQDVTSNVVSNSSYGRAYNCYWPMPFRKNAKITVTNDSDQSVGCLFWYVDYEKKAIPAESPYFHAQYRQENPVIPNEDYLIFDGQGKGFYAGTVLSVRMSMPGWFGEGDDRFYIDGSEEPVLKGTGTEDYFSDAWAFRTLNRPYYGITVWEGMVTGGRCTAYRWHIKDPIFFSESLKFTIEHKGNTFDANDNLTSAYTPDRPDFYSSVAFWYQTGQAIRFAQIPPAKERYPEYTLLQAEELIDVNQTPDTQIIQNGSMLQFNNTTVGGTLEIPFNVEQTGKYAVFLGVMPFNMGGIYDIYLDGRLIRDFDAYREHSFVTDVKLGNVQNLETGTHTIKLVCKGSNNDSFSGNEKGRMLWIDYICLEKVGIVW